MLGAWPGSIGCIRIAGGRRIIIGMIVLEESLVILVVAGSAGAGVNCTRTLWFGRRTFNAITVKMLKRILDCLSL